MRSSDWTKVVFIRDPLERLLSSYLDKCLVVNSDWVIGNWCFGLDDFGEKKKPSFEEFVTSVAFIITLTVVFKFSPRQYLNRSSDGRKVMTSRSGQTGSEFWIDRSRQKVDLNHERRRSTNTKHGLDRRTKT